MKRFHVHVAVQDLAASTKFYATVFGQAPTVEKPDYAKWMLEDPKVNFAISTRASGKTGVDHLGFQVDSDDALKGLQAQLQAADAGMVTEENTACCYARSDKYWVVDPTGIAWETFHTLGSAPVYGSDRGPQVEGQLAQTSNACCGPNAAGQTKPDLAAMMAMARNACGPQTDAQGAKVGCCG